jgi:catechol 2,3-dioxygenase-like lactoylglutathione lyase family enzyme
MMLTDKPIDVVLLAPDLAESRSFYADKLALEIVSEDENSIVFSCGGDSRIELSASTTGTADEQTQASWRVDDLASELAELRARGVEIMDYDTPELQTENGIFDSGDALHAWIVDPGKNMLGIKQQK